MSKLCCMSVSARNMNRRWLIAPTLLKLNRKMKVRAQPVSPFHFTTQKSSFLDIREKDHEKKEQKLMLQHKEVFDKESVKDKNKKTFHKAVSRYLDHQGVQRRGHVEFIYASLDKMKEFGVEKDLDTYKKIIGLFPKVKMVATSVWQKELMHYPKQQNCLIDVLDKMESHGVIPDDDVGYEIIKIFGQNTHPFRKYQRMMYWMPKFKYANPYYVPHQLPIDSKELAIMALKRMVVDLENKITVFEGSDIDNSIDDTYIVSAQSPGQRDLILDHPNSVPLYVEGGFTTWLRDQCLTYFVLRSDQTERHQIFHQEKKEEDDLKFNFYSNEEPVQVIQKPTIHEQADGTILAMCITGTSSKDSLASWIKGLQQTIPKLSNIPVVFLLKSPETGLQIYNIDHESQDLIPDTDKR